MIAMHLGGLSTGQLFLYGVVVGVVAMLGLSMLLGSFSRRMASRGSQRKLKGARRESESLRLEHERLTQQLKDERAEHGRAVLVTPRQPASVAANGQPFGQSTEKAEGAAADEAVAEPAAHAQVVERPGLLQRIGHHAGGRP